MHQAISHLTESEEEVLDMHKNICEVKLKLLGIIIQFNLIIVCCSKQLLGNATMDQRT